MHIKLRTKTIFIRKSHVFTHEQAESLKFRELSRQRSKVIFRERQNHIE